MITEIYLHKVPNQQPEGTAEEQWQHSRMLRQQQTEALNSITGAETVAFRNLITSMLPIDQNTVISPSALLCSLLFLSDVCGEKARKEILRALCYNSSKAGFAAENIRKGIVGCNKLSECHIDNSLWANASAPVREDILSAICKVHHADAFMGEMGSEEMNKAIQQWLNTNTGNILKKYVSVHTDRDTLFELLTASFFMAKWHDEFWPSQTKKDYFHVDANTDVYCYFMNQNGHAFCNCGYQYTAVSKDLYMDYQMWFILPNKGVPLNSLLSNHSVLKLLSDPSSMILTEYNVAMSIPKFDVTSNLDLKTMLESMGIKSLFDKTSTDASPITLGIPLVLNKAKHVSRVKITEDGVEAAAYADFGLAAAAISPKLKKLHFKLDRPFLFAITKSNKVPIYVGAVYTPV